MATVTILHSRNEPSEMVSLEQLYRRADLLMFFGMGPIGYLGGCRLVLRSFDYRPHRGQHIGL